MWPSPELADARSTPPALRVGGEGLGITERDVEWPAIREVAWGGPPEATGARRRHG